MTVLSNILNDVLSRRLLLHILYWIGVFCFFCIYSLGFGQPLYVTFYVVMVDLPFQILATYSLIYLQLPILYKERYVFFVLLSIFLAYLFYLGVHFNHDFGIGKRLISWHKPHTAWEIFFSGEFLFRNIVDIYIVVFFSAIFKYIKDNLEGRSRVQSLQVELAQVQYQALISKIEPTLILDSLDMIIDQSKTKSDNLPVLISNLSEVLDGVLYKSKASAHSIDEEISQINRYLDLFTQVYPEHRLASMDSMLSDAKREIKVLSLRNPLVDILNVVKNKGKPSTFEILVMDQPTMMIQLSLLSYIASESDLQEIREVLLSKTSSEIKYDMMIDNEDLIIKLIVQS